MTMESVFYDDERPLGNLFEIANGEALGSSEESLLDRVQRVAGDLVAQERHARQRLAHDHPDVLADAVGRAYGTLRFGYRLDAAEAVGMLSALRLGLDLGMIETLDTAALNRLLMLTQPGHLAAETGRELEPDEIDRVRADTMRLHLRHADRQAPGKG
jgi:protein arginine kinase